MPDIKLPTPLPDRSDLPVDSELFDPLRHAREYAGIDIGSEVRGEKEQKLVELVWSRVEQSAQFRKEAEVRYKESLSMWKGDQWIEWLTDGSYNDLRDLSDPDRVYRVINRIRPAIRKHLARALSARTSISISPATGRMVDLASARQARAVASHLEYSLRDTIRLFKAVLSCHVFGPIFEYTYIDAHTIVPVPVYDAALPDGEFDVEDAPLGEVCGEVLFWTDVGIDPKTRTSIDDEADWIIAPYKKRSLNYIRSKWKAGRLVQPQTGSFGSAGSTQIEVETMVGNRPNTTPSGNNRADVATMWEQPSDLYPKGLYVVVAGDRVMDVRAWPYTTLRHPTRSNRFLFPITPLIFQEGIDTIWGDNAVSPAIGAQRTLNRQISRIDEHTKNGDGKILAPRGAEIDDGAFASGRRNEIVYYTVSDETGEREPRYMPIPPLDQATTEMVRLINEFLDETLEVADVSRGLEPSAGASGAAIQALQDADNSSASLFTENYKEFIRQVTYKRLKLAEDLYHEDRLVYVQDTAPATPMLNQAGDAGTLAVPGDRSPGSNTPGFPPQTLDSLPVQIQQILAQQNQVQSPAGQLEAPIPGQAQTPNEDDPKMQALSFKDFARGRYTVEASISSVRSPAQRTELIFNMAKAGMFAPAMIPVTIAFLKLMEIEDADKLTTDLLVALQQIQAREDAQAQQQADADASAAAAKGQQDAQTKAQLLTMQTQAQSAIEQQKAANARSTEAARAEADIAVESARHQLTIAQQTHKAGLDAVNTTHEAIMQHHATVHQAGIAQDQALQNSALEQDKAIQSSALAKDQAEHAARLAPKKKDEK